MLRLAIRKFTLASLSLLTFGLVAPNPAHADWTAEEESWTRIKVAGRPARVSASRTLPSKTGRYEAKNAFDGKPETAWAARWEKDTPEFLHVTFEEAIELEGFSFIPGYARSLKLWRTNLVPSEITLFIDDDAIISTPVPVRQTASAREKCELMNESIQLQPRFVALEKPVKGRRFMIMINSVHQSSSTIHQDMAISEVTFYPSGQGTTELAWQAAFLAVRDVVKEVQGKGERTTCFGDIHYDTAILDDLPDAGESGHRVMVWMEVSYSAPGVPCEIDFSGPDPAYQCFACISESLRDDLQGRAYTLYGDEKNHVLIALPDYPTKTDVGGALLHHGFRISRSKRRSVELDVSGLVWPSIPGCDSLPDAPLALGSRGESFTSGPP